MKKLVLLVLVAMVAAVPAEAATKKKAKKMKKAPAVAAQVDPNANGKRLVMDAIPTLMPTAFKVIYFSRPENRAKYK